MVKATLTFLFIFLNSYSIAQTESESASPEYLEILEFQKKLNDEFKDPEESPLPEEKIKLFEAHEFFPVNMNWRVEAQLILTPDAPVFEMPTTTTRKPLYKKYATAVFTVDTISYALSLFQNIDLAKKEEYKNYLFLPFKDYTNGLETYGGGRYIDMEIPEGDTIVIDFNRAYNPYCAYSARYSCPIPPDENSLPVSVEAGIKYHADDH